MLSVTPIASTILHLHQLDYTPYRLANGTDADQVAEFAGRACYQSWDRPNPLTAENRGYLKNILDQGHESVLEHASITFYVTGVSRSLTHELIRHRHLSFSELSQRYVDLTDWQLVRPPGIRDNYADTEDDWVDLWQDYTEDYEFEVSDLRNRKGVTRKEARQTARWRFPNATETRIVVTGNVRAWRDVLKKRYHVAADTEIREFAAEVLRHLRDFAPSCVQDFPDEPFGTE